MKVFTQIFCILLLCLFCFQCAEEKEELVTGELFTIEEAGPAVSLPMVSDEMTWMIKLPDHFRNVEHEAVWRILTDQIISQLDSRTYVQLVQIQQSQASDYEYDYLLSGVCERVGDQYQYDLQWKDHVSGNSELINGQNKSLFSLCQIVIQRLFADAPGNIPPKQSCFYEIPPEIEKQYFQTKTYLVENQYDKTDMAIRQLKTILEIDSTFMPAWTGLTEAYLQIVDHQWNRNRIWLELAKATNQQCIAQNPEPVKTKYLSGRILSKWGDFKQAKEMYLDCLSDNPNFAPGWLELAKAYSKFGLYQAGLDAYDRTLDLNPENISALTGSAMIQIAFRDYEASWKNLEKANRFDPENPRVLTLMGLTQHYLNHPAKARQWIEGSLILDDSSELAHAVLGMIYANSGDPDNALNEVVMYVDPYIRSNYNLAVASAAVYALLNMKGKAIQLVEKAVESGYREYPWLVNDPNFRNLKNDPRMEPIFEDLKGRWEKAKSTLM